MGRGKLAVNRDRAWVYVLLLFPFVVACWHATSSEQAVITLDPSTTYQTITGWEATAQIGDTDFFGTFQNWRDQVLDLAANDLGINRLRVEIRGGTENPTDYFARYVAGTIPRAQWVAHRDEIINDNADANAIDPDGFQWSALDFKIENIALPLRRRLRARGETLFLNVNYVDFERSSFEHASDPAEYAEFVLATYQHLQTKYGIVPDAWEVILEPNNTNGVWRGVNVGQAIVAAAQKLTDHGFTPRFIATSNSSIESTARYFTQMVEDVPDALRYQSELSYHIYGSNTDAFRQMMADLALPRGLKTAQLERIGATYQDLHKDLKIAMASAWQQYTLAYPTQDNGAQYYVVDANNSSVTLGNRTKFLRQYFKFIRQGAVRIGAATSNNRLDPLAFRNADGKYVVVVNASAGGSFSIQGLPAGVYGIKYTTANQFDVDAADVTVSPGQDLRASIPQTGVITVYAKTSSGGPPSGQALVNRCDLRRTASGSFRLSVYGSNIKAGAAVTVGGVTPKKVKFKDEVSPGQGVFTRVNLKGGICDGLPGPIRITNPGAPPSEPFQCASSCQ